MTSPSGAFVTILLLSSVVLSQSAVSGVQPSATGSQSGAGPLSPQQVTELAEATRLSVDVVKLYNQQEYDSALPLAKRVLEIRERILGAEGPLVAAALVNLAEVYLGKGKYSESLALYLRVLPIYEKAFGTTSDHTAIIVESLAFLSYVKGNFDQAEGFYQRALAIRESVSGEERLEVANAVYKLAEFYRSRAAYKKAEPLFLRAIAINDKINEKTSTWNDPDAGRVLQRYTCFLYESRPSYEEARKAEEEFFAARGRKAQPVPVSIGSGAVINGRAISLPRPEFPAEAKQLRVSGVVRIQVLIDETGKVIEAKLICGHPIFAKPALQSANKARFSPTKLSGMPVKVNGIIVYNFESR